MYLKLYTDDYDDNNDSIDDDYNCDDNSRLTSNKTQRQKAKQLKITIVGLICTTISKSMWVLRT